VSISFIVTLYIYTTVTVNRYHYNTQHLTALFCSGNSEHLLSLRSFMIY